MPANKSIQISLVGQEAHDQAFLLLQRFFQEEGFSTPPEMRAFLGSMMSSPGSAVFLACLGGQPVGVATATTSIGLEHGLSAEMEDLYVLPQARGRGIASALIEAVRSWCTDLGCNTLEVCITPEGQARHDLIGFYQQHGFTNTGRLILEHKL